MDSSEDYCIDIQFDEDDNLISPVGTKSCGYFCGRSVSEGGTSDCEHYNHCYTCNDYYCKIYDANALKSCKNGCNNGRKVCIYNQEEYRCHEMPCWRDCIECDAELGCRTCIVLEGLEEYNDHLMCSECKEEEKEMWEEEAKEAWREEKKEEEKREKREKKREKRKKRRRKKKEKKAREAKKTTFTR